MKQVWNSFRLAFSMYSVVPARQVEKTKDNMKYILCFVPWVKDMKTASRVILLAIGFFILFLLSVRYIFQHFKFLMISQYSFCDLLPM